MSIGFACQVIGEINTAVSQCRLKNANHTNLHRITSTNLSALEAMVDYCINKEISLFRISSDIIPFASHPEIEFAWQDGFKESFTRIGGKLRKAGIRVSMHPGPYTVLNSPDPRVVGNAIADLQYHAEFLDALSTGRDSKIIIHIGGVYGDKHQASAVFTENLINLDPGIRHRLVIENDEKNYSAEDVLKISKITEIPVVFDILHHMLNPSLKKYNTYELIEVCSSTWKSSDGKPKIHYSQSKTGDSRGAHSNTIDVRKFTDFYIGLPDKDIDIMLEVKDKNLSAIKCINAIHSHLPIRRLEEEWSRYKYLILSKSGFRYQEINDLLNDKTQADAISFYYHIEEAMKLREDREAQINTAQLIWGYIKKDCSEAEHRRYHKLIQQYSAGTARVDSLRKHLFKCAVNQKIYCLLNSYYFYL